MSQDGVPVTPAKARGAGVGGTKLAEYTAPSVLGPWPLSSASFQPYRATGSVWKRPRSTTVVVMIACHHAPHVRHQSLEVKTRLDLVDAIDA